MPDQDTSTLPTCTATTRAGKPCPNRPVHGQDVCFSHSEDAVEARKLGVVASAEARRERVEARKQASEAAQLGVREALKLRLGERVQDVVRLMVDEAIEDGDVRTLLAAVNQAFGTPAQTLDVTERKGLDTEALDRMRALWAEDAQAQ